MTREHKHEWHFYTNFCIHCGQSRQKELDNPTLCFRNKKVTAISHIRSSKRLKDIFDVIRTPFKNYDNSSQ